MDAVLSHGHNACWNGHLQELSAYIVEHGYTGAQESVCAACRVAE